VVNFETLMAVGETASFVADLSGTSFKIVSEQSIGI